MARQLNREDTVQTLKWLIGRVDDEGNEIVGPDDAPSSPAPSSRSRDEIRKIAEEMADNEAQRLAARRR